MWGWNTYYSAFNQNCKSLHFYGTSNLHSEISETTNNAEQWEQCMLPITPVLALFISAKHDAIQMSSSTLFCNVSTLHFTAVCCGAVRVAQVCVPISSLRVFLPSCLSSHFPVSLHYTPSNKAVKGKKSSITEMVTQLTWVTFHCEMIDVVEVSALRWHWWWALSYYCDNGNESCEASVGDWSHKLSSNLLLWVPP